MQAFLEYVVEGLVDNPGAVTVTPVEREGSTIYELRLDPQMWARLLAVRASRSTRFALCCSPAARQKVFGARWKLSRTNLRAWAAEPEFAHWHGSNEN